MKEAGSEFQKRKREDSGGRLRGPRGGVGESRRKLTVRRRNRAKGRARLGFLGEGNYFGPRGKVEVVQRWPVTRAKRKERRNGGIYSQRTKSGKKSEQSEQGR